MIASGGYFINNMNQSIEQGFLTEDDVDAALYDLLMLRFRLGLFDPIEDQPYWNVSPDVVQSDASRNLSLLSSQQVSLFILLLRQSKTAKLRKNVFF